MESIPEPPIKTVHMYKKIRHVHIPKTAGTALNTIIYNELGLRHVHIANIKDQNNNIKNIYDLESKSLAYKFARNNLYLSGHISFSDMKKLDGDFIFTTLRDPRQRIVSLYTYQQTRIDRGRDIDQKSISGNFMEFISKKNIANGIFKILCADFLFQKGYIYQEIQTNSNVMKSVIRRALKRFNTIYFCSIQDILNDLAFRQLIPMSQEIIRNTSLQGVQLGNLGSKQNFLEQLDKLTYLDSLVVSMASELFPETVKQKALTNDEFIKYLEDRFDCKFSREF